MTPIGCSNMSLSQNLFPFLPIVLSRPDAAQMTPAQPRAQALNNEERRAYGHQQKVQNQQKKSSGTKALPARQLKMIEALFLG